MGHMISFTWSVASVLRCITALSKLCNPWIIFNSSFSRERFNASKIYVISGLGYDVDIVGINFNAIWIKMRMFSVKKMTSNLLSVNMD